MPGVIAELRRSGVGLEAHVTGVQDSQYLPIYFPENQWVSLVAVGIDEFELVTPRADRLHIDRDARGQIVGLTINPGPWPVRARRLPTG